MSYAWMSHVLYTNVMSYTRTSHVSHVIYTNSFMRTTWHMNESCPLHERVMFRTWMRHVTHVTSLSTHRIRVNYIYHRLWHAYNSDKRVMAYTSRSHTFRQFLRTDASSECVMSYTWMSHVLHMNTACHTCCEACQTYNTYEWVVANTIIALTYI